jgi:hypothetical protein
MLKLLACLGLLTAAAAQFLIPANLRVDGRALPAYIDHQRPRFSWDLTCGASLLACRGRAQSSYRIVVQKDHDSKVVCDTGRKYDLGNFQQPVSPHTKLLSDTSYRVTLSVWAEGQDVPATLTEQLHTALFEQDDWAAKWIGGSTQMRASFTVKSTSAITSASAFYSGLGCASLSLNGEKSTDSALDPGFSTVPTMKILYRAVNVTSMIKSGANAVGMRTGMCKYGYLESYCTGANGANAKCRGAILQLSIKFADGSTQSITTDLDKGWTGTTDLNPIRYTHLFHGEIFDARLLANEWDQSSFAVPSAGWDAVTLYNTSADGVGDLSLHAMPPIGVSKSFTPINITTVPAPTPGGGGGGSSIPLVCAPSSGLAGVASEGEDVSLNCTPGSGTIKTIDFASYGTPFYGRFVKGSGPDIYWTSDGTSNGTKHHIASCEPCPGLSACEGVFKFVTVSDQVLSALTTGPEFKCTMLGNCADFAEEAGCAAKNVVAVVSKLCVGKTSCAIPVSVATFGPKDPCLGTKKQLMVRASGCTAIPTPGPPTPASDKSHIFDMGQVGFHYCSFRRRF